ncbi:MAG TPA: PAS domain S-box protein, partial [Candidatus Polarisedimenticolaceae bacterium]|nr:PAS domain S-box protein [Candidatus Polarisedimenticolaceae bacterium]
MAQKKSSFHDAAVSAPVAATLDVSQIWESMQDGLMIVGLDDRIMYANPAASRLFGTGGKAIGHSLAKVINEFSEYGFPDASIHVEGDAAAAHRQALLGNSSRLVVRLVRPASQTALEALVGPYYDAERSIAGVLISLHDQTQDYAEKEKMRIVQQSHSIGVIMLDTNNVVTSVSSRLPQLNEALADRPIITALKEPPLSQYMLLDMEMVDVLRQVKKGREVTFYAETTFKDRIQHLQLVACPIDSSEGNEGTIITTRDVTALVNKTIEANEMARLASQHSRELTSLAELGGFVGFRFDKIYKKYLTVVNSLLQSTHASIYLYETSKQRLKRVATSTEFNEHPPSLSLDDENPIAQTFVRRKAMSYDPVENNTQAYPEHLLAVPVTFLAKAIGVVAVSHRRRGYDTHDQRLLGLVANRLAVIIENAELYNEVNARRERWEAVFKFAEEGIVIFNRKGRVAGFNPAAGKMTGLTINEVMGKRFIDVVKTVSPEGLDLSALSPVKRVLEEGDVVTKRQQLLQSKNGQTIWTEVSYSPIYNDDHAVTSGIAIISNIQKEREVEAVKSDFISIVSHELRTPLTAIKGFLSMLLKQDFGTLSDKQFHFMNRVYQTNQRMIGLVEDLLDMSHIESGKIRLKVAPLA